MRTRFRLFVLFVMVVTLLTIALHPAPASAHEAEAPAGDRPTLPSEQTIGTEHFLLHYTLSGGDAIDGTDDDSSGEPDYAEAAAKSLEYVWDVEINQYGWAPPPPDGTLGGDARIDVYFEDLIEPMGAAGYTDMDGGFVGDNPNSPELERRAAFSYLSLENDYIDTEDPDGINAIEYLESTAAHEFNHVLQAGYDAYDVHSWIYESTATWMEEEVYPEIHGGVYYLDDTFGQPDTCIVAREGWYGNYLFMKMLSEHYGQDVIRSVWENMRAREGFDALDLALANYDSSLAQEVQDYGVAMLLRDFEEGDLYPGIYLEGTANEGTFSPNSGVDSLGVDFVRLQASGVVSVTLNSDAEVLGLRAVGIRGTDADVIDAVNGILTLDTNAYDEVFLLVQNHNQIAEEDQCDSVDYSLNVAASSDASTAVTVVRSAEHYGNNASTTPPEDNDDDQPAGGEPFGGGNSAGVSTTPHGLGEDVSFTPIVPDSVPAGYTFSSGYVMTAEDFGDSAQYYMPSAEESANYDYYDAEDHILSITESPSVYGNIPDWLADINYETPGEFIDVAGTQVLIEDLSDSDRTYFSATVIHDGLFIVVDGDEDRDTVLAMVESILKSLPDQPDAQPTATVFAPTAAPEIAQTLEPTATQIVPGINDDDLFAGLSAASMAICCSLLCVVVFAVGLAIFLISRRRKARQQQMYPPQY